MADIDHTIVDKINKLEKELSRVSAREVAYTPGDILASFMLIPGLRGLWAMSSINESSLIIDYSGQGRSMSSASASFATLDTGISYASFAGAQYLSRADEAGIDITSTLTFGGWFYHTNNASVNESNMSKTGAPGQFAYGLVRLSTGIEYFYVSSNGSNFPNVVSTETTLGASWKFIVGRYNPSTELALFVNGIKYTNTVGVPASLFNSTAPLRIGASTYSAPAADYMTGRATMCFVSAYAYVSDEVINRLFRISRGYFQV